MKLRLLTGLVTLSLLLAASVSFGWESETRDGVRDMPIVGQKKSFAGGPKPFVSQTGIPDYDPTEVFVTNLKDRVGGVSADAGDTTTANKFYVCPSSFTRFARNSSNLVDCKPATDADLSAQWAWLRARKANDDPTDSEHYLMTKAAANLTGLSSLTLLDPFWIRYPVENAYLAPPTATRYWCLKAGSLRPVC